MQVPHLEILINPKATLKNLEIFWENPLPIAIHQLLLPGHDSLGKKNKLKLIFSSSLQCLLHNSQSFFQAILYLNLSFLSGYYTGAEKV